MVTTENSNNHVMQHASPACFRPFWQHLPGTGFFGVGIGQSHVAFPSKIGQYSLRHLLYFALDNFKFMNYVSPYENYFHTQFRVAVSVYII
jgi:hypothetical protein